MSTSYESRVIYSLCRGKEGGEKREVGEIWRESTGDKRGKWRVEEARMLEREARKNKKERSLPSFGKSLPLTITGNRSPPVY